MSAVAVVASSLSFVSLSASVANIEGTPVLPPLQMSQTLGLRGPSLRVVVPVPVVVLAPPKYPFGQAVVSLSPFSITRFLLYSTDFQYFIKPSRMCWI